jgi:hypothetical protein
MEKDHDYYGRSIPISYLKKRVVQRHRFRIGRNNGALRDEEMGKVTYMLARSSPPNALGCQRNQNDKPGESGALRQCQHHDGESALYYGQARETSLYQR